VRWLLAVICGSVLWAQSAGSAATHEALANSYARQGKKAEAAAEFEKAIALAPGNEQYPFELAQLYFYQQDFASAVRVLEAAQKRFPNSAQIELALGVGYYGQRRFDDTVKAFLRTIDLAPDVSQPYMFLGKILDHAGARLPEVTAKFVAWEKANPNNAEAPLLHAKALLARPGENPAVEKQAEELLNKSIELNAYSAEPYFELGCLMDQEHNYPRAAELLKKSVDLDVTNAAAHYRLARVYQRLGRKEEAAAEMAMHAKLSGTRQQDLERRGIGAMAPQ
jgi:tetratricopeptide (TPR) repeat protein